MPAFKKAPSRRSANVLISSPSAWAAARSPESEARTTTPRRVFLAEARVSGLRPVTMTFAPWALKSWAVARPMPVVPPVIRMVLVFMEYRSLVPYLRTIGLFVKSVLETLREATLPSRCQRHYCRGPSLCLVRSRARPDLRGNGHLGMPPELLQLPPSRKPHLAQGDPLPAFQNPARGRPDP